MEFFVIHFLKSGAIIPSKRGPGGSMASRFLDLSPMSGQITSIHPRDRDIVTIGGHQALPGRPEDPDVIGHGFLWEGSWAAMGLPIGRRSC